MTATTWKHLLEMRFVGASYADGGLDRAALLEIANLQTLLVFYAADRWRARHNDSDPPSGFVAKAQTRASVVAGEPATVRLAREDSDEQVGACLDDALERIMKTLLAGETRCDFLADVGHPWLTNIKAIGRVLSLEQEEPIELRISSPTCGEVRVSRDSRIAIVREMDRRIEALKRESSRLQQDAPWLASTIDRSPEDGLDSPTDGSTQVDHYAYGTPKDPVSV